MSLRATALSLLLCLPALAQERPPQAPQTPEQKLQDAVDEALYRAHVDLIERLLARDLDARAWRRSGDDHKERGRFPEAAVHYLIALKLDPKHSYAAYQLACAFSLWGQKKMALTWLERAVELGFWGYPVMKDDSDLEGIAGEERFKACLAKVQARYPEASKQHPGKPVLVLPQGQAPAAGWPVLVLLHGWGDNAESYRDLASEAAKVGVAGLALPGPVALMEGSYHWPTEAFAPTHDYVQRQLAAAGKGLDRAQVFLLGFSQGAQHSLGLVAGYPDHYRGALALSPGGSLEAPQEAQGSGKARRLLLTVGKQEHERIREQVTRSKALWERMKWPVQLIEHAEGHRFPPDFYERFPKLLAWVRGEG